MLLFKQQKIDSFYIFYIIIVMKKIRPRVLKNTLVQKMPEEYKPESIKPLKKTQDFNIVDKIISYVQEKERF